MTIYDSVLDKAVAAGNERAAEGETYTQDGLLYCAKCGQPRQRKGSTENDFERGKMFPVMCKCQEQEKEREQQAENRKAAKALRAECLPKALRKCTFENADTSSKAASIAQRYVEHWQEMAAENHGIIFWGNVGSGKSFLAICIANALIDQGIKVKYITATALINGLSGSSANRGALMSEIENAPLLIIDDLGAEYANGYTESTLCEAIEARKNSGKPLIVTTNYTIAEMDNAKDGAQERMFDRIKEICSPVAVLGASRRQSNAKEANKRFAELLGIN